MPKKILVVDDSPTVRNVAESLLRKHGYEVLLADNGAKALGMAKANKPDLIFLDDSISILNGEQVCKELKQNASLKDVPVIILLTEDEIEKKRELKLIGADAFLTKPFNPREILEHVKRLLEKEKTFLSEDARKTNEDLPPDEDAKSDEKETQKTAPLEGEKKSEDVLDIVETSDIMESLESSASGEERAHGFEWFLSELKKNTKEDEKADKNLKDKPIFSGDKISGKEAKLQMESKIYEIDEHEKGFEDFLKELKQEVDKEKSTLVKPSAREEISRSQFDQLLSDLKEKISERVAEEVAKKISPEFLEKIIREEIAKLGKDSSRRSILREKLSPSKK